MSSSTDDSVALHIDLVGRDNLSACGIGCVGNRRHVGFAPKVAWLGERFPSRCRNLLRREVAVEAS